MKKYLCLFIAVCLMAGMPPFARGEGTARPRVILYTYYRQMGWGDRVQIGCVDEEGGLWLCAGHDASLHWPYQTDEQLARLQARGEWEQAGTLSFDGLFTLTGLVSAVPDQGSKSRPAACDAGTEYSYAVQYGKDGAPRCLLLGMSGDDCFENTDPGAQALYLCLRRLFPQVTCYGDGMGPAGFQPAPVRAFCGWEEIDFSGVEVAAFAADCEAGPRALSLNAAERERLLRLLRQGVVTGKANAMRVTGGTVVYSFSDPAGNCLASLELYHGLLVRSDGMYYITEQ